MFNFKNAINGFATKGEEVCKSKVVSDIIGGFTDGVMLTTKVGIGMAAKGAEAVASLIPDKKEKGEKTRVDNGYINVVEEMINEGRIQAVIDSMKEKGDIDGLAKLYDAMKAIADDKKSQ